MNKYVLATNNNNKILELRSQLIDLDLISLEQLGHHTEIIETGNTLEENALIKSTFIFNHYNLPTISDDTGLEVEALNGKPGVFSARYAGEPSDSKANINKLLSELEGVSNRKARFRTVICLKTQIEEMFFEGVVNGRITNCSLGENGFGYDSVFVAEGFDKTFAQMSLKTKNEISHRYLAVQKLVEYLQ